MKSASEVILELHTLGDTVALRTMLTVYSKSKGWESGKLIYSSGEEIWTYQTQEVEKNGGMLVDFVNKYIFGSDLFTLSHIVAYEDGEKVATLVATISNLKFWDYHSSEIVALFFILCAFGVCTILVSGLAFKKTLGPMYNLMDDVKEEAKKYGLSLSEDRNGNEAENLRLWFKELVKAWARSKEEIEKNASMVAYAQIAASVNHDIRSPLQALQTMVSRGGSGTTGLVSSAVDRIMSILKDLEGRSTGKVELAKIKRDKGPVYSKVKDIFSGVESILEEKRILYPDIDFILEPSSLVTAEQVRGERTEILRSISNLIINGIEASLGGGVIRLTLQIDKQKLLISVEDFGKGIAPEILPLLGDRGVTFGKSKGSGLGLYSAKKMTEKYDGNIDIRSELDQGTTVSVVLPLSGVTTNSIHIKSGGTLVVCDDDETTLHNLRALLRESGYEDLCEVKYFSSPEKLLDCLEGFSTENTTFVIDQHLNASLTGLDLHECLGKYPIRYLYTSAFFESEIIEMVEFVGAQLLPKDENIDFLIVE